MLDLPPPRPHITALDAAKLLDAAATAASNISGLSAGKNVRDLRDDYLRKTEDLQRLLGQAFDDEATDANADALPTADYVRTEAYWRIRTADASMPRLITLILEEAEALQRRLLRLRDWMRQEDARWGRLSCMLAVAVPDTTMFLTNGLPINEIDWQASLESSDAGVAIVAPLVVVHELDRLKRQGNSTAATAARGAIRWLLDVLPTDPANRSARLPSSGNDTTIEIYVHGGPTRPSDADGVIIDFARRLASIASLPTVLVTRDLGMKLRAEQYGVQVRLLPEPEPVTKKTGKAAPASSA